MAYNNTLDTRCFFWRITQQQEIDYIEGRDGVINVYLLVLYVIRLYCSTMENKNEVNITQLVNQYTSDLFLWASYKVSDTELAKDLVQDTFLVAAEKIYS